MNVNPSDPSSIPYRRRQARRERIGLALGREEVSSGTVATIIRKVKSTGRSGVSRVRAVEIGKAVGGRFSSNPAIGISYRIRHALRVPDPMPELRRRLRELRGE